VLSYALEYAGGVALVDTGWPADEAWDGLVSGLGQAGWDIDDVKAVLITHGHGDHMGLARRIRERTGAWVAMHEADTVERYQYDSHAAFRRASAEWLRKRGGEAGDFRAVGQDDGPEAAGKLADFMLVPDRFLIDGEQPLGPGTSLTSVWTPGHTPGHVCFADTYRDVVLTGDHILPRITPNISPAPHETADLLGQYLVSLSALARRAASLFATGEVLPAHEYRFIGLDERVRGLRGHHEARLGEVMTALRGTPGLTSVQVAEALRWSRPWDQMLGVQRRFAIGEAYSHLVHLEHTGYIANSGLDVDDWHAVKDTSPTLL
jgi:glyoxylase-like metal-dependent hydrolase (beta-lactamase superfamily II)